MKFKQTEIGKIPVHWRVVSIKEIGKVVGGGTPSTKKKEYFGGSIPWITPKDLSGYNRKRIQRGERNITELGLKNSSAKLLPKNTVLLSSRAPIGYVAIADNPLTTNQGFRSIICDESKIIPDYLYYYLKMSKYSLENLASGSTFKEISGKVVEEFKIPLPPLEEQRRITRILSLLDSKIELNETIIGNMEQLAQTLFKRWFIDFEFPNEHGEPYRSSGGKMVESEIGMIPEGWNVGTLENLGEIVGGGTPSKKKKEYYCDNGIPWITPKDLSNNKSIYIYKGAIDITKEGLENSSARLLPKNAVLFSSRAPIGYVAIAGNEVTTNQGFKSIVPHKYISSEYVYLLLKHLTPIIESNANGSTFKEISGADMKSIKTYIPPTRVMSEFHGIVSVLFEKIKISEKENNSLRELRDSLLPKLLSGEIESGEIELPDEDEVTEDVMVQ